MASARQVVKVLFKIIADTKGLKQIRQAMKQANKDIQSKVQQSAKAQQAIGRIENAVGKETRKQYLAREGMAKKARYGADKANKVISEGMALTPGAGREKYLKNTIKDLNNMTNQTRRGKVAREAATQSVGVQNNALSQLTRNMQFTAKQQNTMNRGMASMGFSQEKFQGGLNKLGYTVRANGKMYETWGKQKEVPFSKAMNKMTQATSKFQMQWLGAMFGAMAIKRVFQGLIDPAMKAAGVFELVSITLTVLFLPIAIEVLKVLLPLAQALMALSQATKLLIGGFAFLGFVLFSVLFIGAQFMLFASSMGIVFAQVNAYLGFALLPSLGALTVMLGVLAVLMGILGVLWIFNMSNIRTVTAYSVDFLGRAFNDVGRYISAVLSGDEHGAQESFGDLFADLKIIAMGAGITIFNIILQMTIAVGKVLWGIPVAMADVMQRAAFYVMAFAIAAQRIMVDTSKALGDILGQGFDAAIKGEDIGARLESALKENIAGMGGILAHEMKVAGERADMGSAILWKDVWGGPMGIADKGMDEMLKGVNKASANIAKAQALVQDYGIEWDDAMNLATHGLAESTRVRLDEIKSTQDATETLATNKIGMKNWIDIASDYDDEIENVTGANAGMVNSNDLISASLAIVQKDLEKTGDSHTGLAYNAIVNSAVQQAAQNATGESFENLTDAVSAGWNVQVDASNDATKQIIDNYNEQIKKAKEAEEATGKVSWTSSGTKYGTYYKDGQGYSGVIPKTSYGTYSQGGQGYSGVMPSVSDAVSDVVNTIKKSIKVDTGLLGYSPYQSYWTGAAGGIVTEPTFGLIGEAGPEAVIPLKNLKQEYSMPSVDVINSVEKTINVLHSWSDTIKDSMKQQITPQSYWAGAAGGIVTEPTFGLIGEAGPEAIIPLDNMNKMGGTTVILNYAPIIQMTNEIKEEMDMDKIKNDLSEDLAKEVEAALRR